MKAADKSNLKMTQEQYLQLYEKYLAGRCTPHEKKQLLEAEDSFELVDLPWQENEMGNKEETKQAIFAELESSSRRVIVPPQKDRSWMWMAAVLALVFLSAGAFFWLKDRNQSRMALQTEQEVAPIEPGGNKAMLTLADGRTLVLDDLANGELAPEGQPGVLKLEGQLVYSSAAEGTEAQYNTIETPRGGQYQVVLPDGTKVWLNAASSLRFPTAFTGPERVVTLTGEAYFEVAKNKRMPFRVAVQDMQVEVLGTHFNVMAYDDEGNVKTTLLEGAVKVRHNKGHAVLEPGQQAVLHRSSERLDVVASNTEEAVAWKNGYFVFDNENIHGIMRKVSRWYDVEVVYEGDMAGKDFVGKVSRAEHVSEVLKTLELTGTIKFKVEGRRIIVMP